MHPRDRPSPDAAGLVLLDDPVGEGEREDLVQVVQGLGAEALEQYQAVQAEDGSFRDVGDRVQRLAGSVEVKARPIVKRPAAPAAAPRKAAAQAAPGPAGRGPVEPEPPEPARKNRKIGFV